MGQDNVKGSGGPEVSPPRFESAEDAIEWFLEADREGRGWYRGWSEGQHLYQWWPLGLSVGSPEYPYEDETVLALVVEAVG